MLIDPTLTNVLESLQFTVSLIGGFVLLYGSLKAFVLFLLYGLGIHQEDRRHRLDDIRLGLGRHLILGMEFLIAADLISTIVTPGWSEVGILAVIVLIRSVLSYFLTRELHEVESQRIAKRR